MTTLRFGIITDLHFAHRPTTGSREYHRSLDKLRFTLDRFNAEHLDLLFILGDLIDQPDNATAEHAALAEIIAALRAFRGQTHILPGNHDLVNFTKPHFLAACGQSHLPTIHRTLVHQGLRFILLDGCFTRADAPYGGAMMDWADSKVSEAQLPFLANQLHAAKLAGQPIIVMLHQTLASPDARHNIANASQVIDILAQSGNVIAAISGHHHAGGSRLVANLPCITIPATVETSTPAAIAGRIVTVHDDLALAVEGLFDSSRPTIQRPPQQAHAMTNFQPATLSMGDTLLVVRPAKLDEILPLRQAILIVGTERSSPIFDGDHDPTTLHFGAFTPDHRPVACASLMLQPDGDAPAWRLRGMATDPAYQRKGVGKALLRYIQQMLLESQGPHRLWCNARINAVPFYRQVGFQSVGESFIIPGVGPHLRMIRWL